MWQPDLSKRLFAGTARRGQDYQVSLVSYPSPDPLLNRDPLGAGTFQPGWTRHAWELVVTPIDDGDHEGPETVKVIVPASADFRLQIKPSQVWIDDDDGPPVPTVRAEVLDGAAAEERVSSGAVRMVRDDVRLNHPLTVHYRFPGTGFSNPAAFDVDYTATSTSGPMDEEGAVTFAPGQRTVEVKVGPLADIFTEGPETARLELFAPDPAAYAVAGGPADVVIADHAERAYLPDPFGLFRAPACDCGCQTCEPKKLQDGTQPKPAAGELRATGVGMPPAAAPGGGNASNKGPHPVRYHDGALEYVAADLWSDALGTGWGVSRSYATNPAAAAGGHLGAGWNDAFLPFLLTAGDAELVVAVGNGTAATYFDWNEFAEQYQSRLFGQEGLARVGGEFVLAAADGGQVRYLNFDPARPAAARGAFESRTDADGVVTEVVGRDAAGRPTEVRRSRPGWPVEEALAYAYGTAGGAAGRQTAVTLLRRASAAAPWQTVRFVEYAYYGSGDLETATTYAPDPAGGTAVAVGTEYYRYAPALGGGGSVLTHAFGDDAYRRLAAAVPDPFAAADAAVAPYADPPDDPDRPVGYNTWARKTVETWPDGGTRTVYTNFVGAVVLSVEADPADPTAPRLATYHQYDGDGRRVLTAYPSAVTGWDEALPDLVGVSGGNAQYVSDAAGLVERVSWWRVDTAGSAAATAGGAVGYLRGTSVRQGELGTPVTQSEVRYLYAPLGGVAVGTETVYQGEAGYLPATASYDHAVLPDGRKAVETTLPAVPAAQGGTGVGATAAVVYDPLGRVSWSKDAGGFLSYTGYDPLSGAAAVTIADVDTAKVADFAGLPAGWAAAACTTSPGSSRTPSGGRPR